jgi:hypothetical protein
MQKYCIDYRNGSMGNTILAHILYASEKVDVDLDDFFSDSGDAHKIFKANTTNLLARHLREFPDPSLTCVIEVYCDDWYECLRQKMSYSKWHKCYPEIHNLNAFFQVCLGPVDRNFLWQQFYHDIRDTSWPDCDSYDDRIYLPASVQEEINRLYQQPSAYNIVDDIDLLEFLSLSYYDIYNQRPQQFYDNSLWFSLKDYLNGSLSALIYKVHTVFPAWNWNTEKSNNFRMAVLKSNRTYIDWMELMKQITQNTLAGNQIETKLQTWEKAVIISRICLILKIDPRTIKWDRFLSPTNISLINYLKEGNYGKAF